MRVVGIVLLVLGLLGVVVAFGARMSLKGEAHKYQVVRKNDADSLFGDSPYENMGSPQTYVVRDQSIVLPTKTDKGLPMVDYDKAGPAGSKYFQLKTGMFYVNYSLISSGVAAVIGGVLAFLVKRKPKPKPA
jgi:hypothetical protein